MLREEEGEGAVRRYRDWQRLDRLDRPLVVLLGGTTGVGKSTVATMLAGRLGITRVIATDVIRQVLRAFFSHEFMPSVHHSAFEAGGIDGYTEQAEQVGTGIAAIVERAADEGKPVVVEGVHVVPGIARPGRARRAAWRSRRCSWSRTRTCTAATSPTAGPGRPAERYLDGLRRRSARSRTIWRTARADAGVPVIDNANVDEALAALMELVLDTVGTEVS